jgi:hypothetical protein
MIDDQFVELQPDGEVDVEFIGMAGEVQKDEKIIDDPQYQGGVASSKWIPTNWDKKETIIRQRMPVELGHAIFGHRAVSSLLSASKAKVWDDIKMVFSGDLWCDMCRIAIAPRKALSKKPMKLGTKPLEMIFLDAIPSPAVLRSVPICRHSQFLFVTDPISKYVEMLPCPDYSSEEAIKTLKAWRSRMVQKGFNMFFYIRSDAGSNFTSKEFSDWCKEENITLTVAAPRHQEQNAFVERTYGTCSKMARAMLVQAHLPITFFQLALSYACKQLRVLPAKGLVDEDSNMTTTYAILHGKKPRI